MTKAEQYQQLLPQIAALMATETNLIANLANITAMLQQTFGFFWVGFYRNIENELVLGPFQGTLACTRIAFGKGVCGAAAEQQKTIIVPNVDLFDGHIACSSLSRSEIVVPLLHHNKTALVLDIDSTELNTFDTTDQHYLEEIVRLIKL